MSGVAWRSVFDFAASLSVVVVCGLGVGRRRELMAEANGAHANANGVDTRIDLDELEEALVSAPNTARGGGPDDAEELRLLPAGDDEEDTMPSPPPNVVPASDVKTSSESTRAKSRPESSEKYSVDDMENMYSNVHPKQVPGKHALESRAPRTFARSILKAARTHRTRPPGDTVPHDLKRLPGIQQEGQAKFGLEHAK